MTTDRARHRAMFTDLAVVAGLAKRKDPGMTVAYFGPEELRKEWEVLTATPVGLPCLWCEEPIVEGDVGTLQGVGRKDDATGEWVADMGAIHYECSMRQVVGSLAHVEGRCSCAVPGATEGDPEGISKREAAVLALRAWQAGHQATPYSEKG